jgi:oxygen-independent coproporphyrinogen-3 oxidase
MAGIYIHIPFCKQACNYCNFHFSTSLKLKDRMLQAIQIELESRAGYLEGQTVETIYIGGGTPSLIDLDDLLRIFDKIDRNFPNQNIQEVTLEANPDDLSNAYIRGLKNTPVNRLSIGVQSFFDEDLKFMNRAHNSVQAEYALKAAQDAGLDNISIDLIYGTPGLTDKKWQQNIATATALAIPHISSYALTVEPKTALAFAIEKGTSKAINESQAAQQFSFLIDELNRAGYQHYEISNFALPNRFAVHNTNYWRGKHYLGIGPSAHSFNGNSRQWNIANNALYLSGILRDNNPPFDREDLSEIDQLNEYIMTGLRTMWGINLDYIENRYGSAAAKELLRLSTDKMGQGLIEVNNNNILLTAAGKLFADGIAADLFFEHLNF